MGKSKNAQGGWRTNKWIRAAIPALLLLALLRVGLAPRRLQRAETLWVAGASSLDAGEDFLAVSCVVLAIDLCP